MIFSRLVPLAALLAVALAGRWTMAHAELARQDEAIPSPGAHRAVVSTVPGMPAVVDPANLYGEAGAGKLGPAVEGALERVYVPNRQSNSVSVIDSATLKVIDTFKVGRHPQHVVPSWDLRTLWVANNAEGRTDGSLTPIDPKTGKPGSSIPVDDPYNVYWSVDGKYAIVVAEAYKRLDFRDARTLKLEYSIATPKCDGINHADFSIDGTFAVFTCEFAGAITKINLTTRAVVDTIVPSRYFDRREVMTLLEWPDAEPRSRCRAPRSRVVPSGRQEGCPRTCGSRRMARRSSLPTWWLTACTS